MTGPAPICAYCVHLRGGDTLACDAFPAGIPDEVLDSKVDHRSPLPGDDGIQWQQDPIKLDLPGFYDRLLADGLGTGG